jgi:phospholipid/cholesterol/gamma-HCH transport system permease protein
MTTEQDASSPYVTIDAESDHLRLQGTLSGPAGDDLYRAVQTLIERRPDEVVIDLSAVSQTDSLGGAWLSRTAELLRTHAVTMRLAGAQGQTRDFLSLIAPTLETSPPAPPRQPGFFETLGDAVLAALSEIGNVGALIVDAIYWTCLAPFTPKGLRWQSVIDELGRIGVRATFIVILMNVLLGLVIALMSAAQLRQFGAEIFVADLVVIAFTRELGPIMTAIIVTARSGSAITAEIATMVVQEEVDALRSMGLNTVQFLVAPKLWAMLIAMPALTVLAMLAGTLGGLEMGVLHLGIDVQTWIRETLAWVVLGDVWQGLIKSLVFGATIVFVGCLKGLGVQGGAQGVGQATTQAVVIDVVLIVVWDMIFALLFEFVI